MLTGDSSKKMEEYITMLDREYLESDVLKVGHHGSKTSTALVFAGFVSPKYAVISAGEDNKYGHPHQEVLDILNKFESKILGTYNGGAVIFESDGDNVILK